MTSAMKVCVLSIATLVSTFAAAGEVPFKGKNCSLKQPPANSGEANAHGYAIKVYPRKKDLPKTFEGCQLVWAPTEKGYELMSATHIVGGQAVAFWSPIDDTYCEFSDGEPTKKKGSCPAFRSVVPNSMPAGCVSKQMAGGGVIAGCVYE